MTQRDMAGFLNIDVNYILRKIKNEIKSCSLNYEEYYFKNSLDIFPNQPKPFTTNIIENQFKSPLDTFKDLLIDLSKLKYFIGNMNELFLLSYLVLGKENCILLKTDNYPEEYYHLPKAGLVISLRTQHFFIEDKTMQEINQLYAYIDKDLNKKLLTEAQIKDNTYLPHIRNGNACETTYDLDKIYHNLNLKISKDFLNGFKFSFYANNFLDLKQTETVLVNGSYIKNIKTDLLTLSFGAKIEYEF